jgi:hypothetical protein
LTDTILKNENEVENTLRRSVERRDDYFDFYAYKKVIRRNNSIEEEELKCLSKQRLIFLCEKINIS